MRFCDDMLKKTKKTFSKGNSHFNTVNNVIVQRTEKNEGVNFLLPAKLNQCCREKYFSRLRGIGGNNNHPGPVEAMDRVRICC